MMKGPLKPTVRCIAPDASSGEISVGVAGLTYCTSANPSLRSSSSATNWGAAQRLGLSPILIVVVSGGGSAATCSVWRPRSPAVTARVSPPTNCRRLQTSHRSLMLTSPTPATPTVAAPHLADLTQCA